MLVETPLIGQKVTFPYMKDANNDILFNMKCIEMKFHRDVYGVRRHLMIRIEPDSIRNTEVTAESTLRHVDRG